MTTAWLFDVAGTADSPNERANARIEAARTGLAAGAGAGAAVGLMLAFRRQRAQEIATSLADFDATERRITELYTKAADQLGSSKAPVRLAGLYALERLAQDNRHHRQTIVNVICAYLRMPYTPPPDSTCEPNASRRETHHLRVRRYQAARRGQSPMLAEGEMAEPDPNEERQVRLAAQRIITNHLRPTPPAVAKRIVAAQSQSGSEYWPEIHLDLTGAVLIDFDLSDCSMAVVDFGDARFVGKDGAMFDGATFTTGALFDGAVFTGSTDFSGATFSGRTTFIGATFNDLGRFSGATFNGPAIFLATRFTNFAWFQDAAFSDHTVFAGAVFYRDADFSGSRFSEVAQFCGTDWTGDLGTDERLWPAVLNLIRAASIGFVEIPSAAFMGDVDFSGSRFTDAIFAETTFTGYADFSHSKFLGHARFNNTAFSSEAFFLSAAFSRSVIFVDAAFADNADFSHVTFAGHIDFGGVVFPYNRCDLNHATVAGYSKHPVLPHGWKINYSEENTGEFVPIRDSSQPQQVAT
jgi:uncharacterized protein YjbI with pentapeptide repeats